MNTYKFGDIYPGLREEFTVCVTQDMMTQFRDMTGDVNPLHCSDAFAKTRGMKGRVVYGMLTASFLSTLAGVFLPGESSLIRKVEISFPSPVYAGEMLQVAGTVTAVEERFAYFTMKVEIRGEDGRKVLRGKMEIGFTAAETEEQVCS